MKLSANIPKKTSVQTRLMNLNVVLDSDASFFKETQCPATAHVTLRLTERY